MARVGRSSENSSYLPQRKPDNGTDPVGELKAHPFRLFDIHENHWEWVQDGWEPAYDCESKEEPAVSPNGASAAVALHVFLGKQLETPMRHEDRRLNRLTAHRRRRCQILPAPVARR